MATRCESEYVSLEESDRAVAERRVAGAIEIVLDRRDRILGVSILAPSPREKMIGLVVPSPSSAGCRFGRSPS